jgi:hypothetical protein
MSHIKKDQLIFIKSLYPIVTIILSGDSWNEDNIVGP